MNTNLYHVVRLGWSLHSAFDLGQRDGEKGEKSVVAQKQSVTSRSVTAGSVINLLRLISIKWV